MKFRFSKHVFSVITLIVIIGAFTSWGCSRKKAGFTSRVYHQTTARFNGYFNAGEIILAVENDLRATNIEDWEKVLPIFIYPDEEKAQSLYPDLDLAIEKCSKVINRHSMRIKNKENNKWIDDNYFLIGKANFYKRTYGTSQEMFSYVAKAFKNQESRHDAGIWLARVYMETDRFSKANSVLKRIDEEKDLAKHTAADLAAVQADYYIRQESWDEAISKLHKAISLSKNKPFRTRLTFILAQVYDKKGDYLRAVRQFANVVKMAPPYEMEFNAKLYQAFAHNSKMDAEGIKKLLAKMLRDVKNEEYRDQIYYAMADVELKERDEQKAMEYLAISSAISNNPKQKAKSCLKLADLYFEYRKYIPAKNYYDSTLAAMDESMTDYEMVKAKTKSLGELVDNILIVQLQDSLIEMAELPDKEREKRLLKMMADQEAEEERAWQAKQSDAITSFSKQDQQEQKVRVQGGGKGGDWYFYNQSTKAYGFDEFRRVWGTRKLEDNWRRSNKSQVFSEDEFNSDSDGEELSSGTFKSSVKSLDEYLSGLPQSDDDLRACHDKIIDATYKMGVIYKEKLDDLDNAIEAFSRITVDYDTSQYALVSNYQLYRLYTTKEQSGSFFGGGGMRDNSGYYRDVILNEYPTSEYAELIRNPDYHLELAKRASQDQTLYETAYNQFRQRQYSDALLTCNTVIQDQPDNQFLAKFYLVKALVIAQRKDVESYKSTLRECISKFPGTEEAAKAQELLGVFGETIEQPKEEAKKDEPIKESPKEPSIYVYDEKASHFFALVFPNKGVNANDLKNTISDFNSSFFGDKGIKVTNSFINSDNQILILRSFNDKTDALDYYNTFVKNTTILKDINSQNFDRFVISTKNFTSLFKQKQVEEYMMFFEENYLTK
jgi:tetratricopeptide (TPR) repeat protein